MSGPGLKILKQGDPRVNHEAREKYGYLGKTISPSKFIMTILSVSMLELYLNEK